MEAFLDHLQPSYEHWWADLASWTDLPSQARSVLLDGLQEELGERSFKEVQDWRDQALLKLISALNELPSR